MLNAHEIEKEAEIVADAGQPGKVTVATNMAGRGTDIKLGPGVAESGGLHVICTELHDSARIDRQLIGRCGRQGDPGTVRQYMSLDDDVIRTGFGPETAEKMETLGKTAAGSAAQGYVNLSKRAAAEGRTASPPRPLRPAVSREKAQEECSAKWGRIRISIRPINCECLASTFFRSCPMDRQAAISPPPKARVGCGFLLVSALLTCVLLGINGLIMMNLVNAVLPTLPAEWRYQSRVGPGRRLYRSACPAGDRMVDLRRDDRLAAAAAPHEQGLNLPADCVIVAE